MGQKTLKIMGWIATCTAMLMYISYFPQIINNMHGAKSGFLQPMVADSTQRLLRCGVVGLLFTAGPHRDFVQDDIFFFNSSVGHKSDTAVAERKRFFPKNGRFIEMISHARI